LSGSEGSWDTELVWNNDACVDQKWNYYGEYYTGCTDVLAEGKKGDGSYYWCPTAVDTYDSFVVGSGAYVQCEQEIANWDY